MANKRIAVSVIASVVVTVIITGGLSYFVLPIIFPGLRESPTFEDEGVVVQSLYTEFDTPGILTDNNLTYLKIPDTEVSISIEENSRTLVAFNAIFILAVKKSFFMSCA